MKRNKVTILELGHNKSGRAAVPTEYHVDMAKHQALLKDPGQVDSPILARLGYPVIIVSTMPGQKCIPQCQVVAVSNSPRNNRMATVAASRVGTGLAMGCVVGNAYALRTDGKDLTAKEWDVLWDFLMQLMDDYGIAPDYVTDKVLLRYKRRLRENMQSQGLLRTDGAGGTSISFST